MTLGKRFSGSASRGGLRTEFIISNNRQNEALQVPRDPGSDVDSQIRAMKRRAGVTTDTELAAAIGRTQGAISHWRRNGAVPESVLLGFDEALERYHTTDTARALAARAVAIRLAEFMFDQNRARSSNAGRWIPYMTVATSFHSIVDAVYESLGTIETDLLPTELAGQLLDDENYLTGLASWARSLSIGEALNREALSPPVIQLRGDRDAVPQSVPQSTVRKARKR